MPPNNLEKMEERIEKAINDLRLEIKENFISKAEAEKAIEKLTEMISGFSQSVNSQ